MSDAPAPLLSVKNLSVGFTTERGLLRAVDSISFDVPKGHVTCLVGESGCGKSVSAHSVMRLLPTHSARISSGNILFHTQDLLGFDEAEMQKIRGGKIGMIFQDPMTALNPVYTVGHQIHEVIRIHQPEVDFETGKSRVIELLAKVGIPDAAARYSSYPHELSGGMRQRVMIAQALACGPELLIADEPTTALDVTIQAQILALLRDLQKDFGMSVLLITHDLGVVAEMADEVVVMYSGRIVEKGKVREVLENPSHPYTRGLLASVPEIALGKPGARLSNIPGQVPSPFARPVGCRFQDRCSLVQPRCREEEPQLERKINGQLSACFEVK